MESSNHGDPTFADRVARAVIDSYDSLPKNGKPAATEWTVLAGIVAARPRNCIPAAGDGGSELGSRSAATQDIEVVALGTGSKCLSGAKLRKDGKVLNDSHAEVLSRRAFIHVLQAQLLELEQSEAAGRAGASPQRPLLEWAPSPPTCSAAAGEDASAARGPGAEAPDGGPCDGARPGGAPPAPERMARMAAGVSLHLYISQPPCGDASIAPGAPDDAAAGASGAPAAKRLRVSTDDKRLVEIEDFAQRTGAKPVAGGGAAGGAAGGAEQQRGLLRYKPGRGDPTKSMSCSDKVARWNVLGLQGASLAARILPIYLSSLVIGGSGLPAALPAAAATESAAAAPLDPAAMEHALAGRVGALALPAGFRVNRPRVLPTSVRFASGREAVEERSIAAHLAAEAGAAGAAGAAAGAAGAAPADGPDAGGGKRGWGGRPARVACNPAGSSLNWAAGDERPEVTIGASGLRMGTTRKNEFGERSLSRLCKLARLRSHRARFPAAGGVRYCDLKVSSPAYARARAALLSETGPFAAWAVNGREYESFGDDGEPQGAAH